jgi:DNA-binding helix-hairpin-helix protein with protein kinase domain
MTCRVSAEDVLAKATAVIERVKRVVVSSPMLPFISLIQRGHFRASQREIEAFWKKNSVRTTAIETHEADMQLKSHLATEIAKDRVFSS